jgi:hypothetical protein
LANIWVSYNDEECDNQFELSKNINPGFIWENLNVMVDILRLMGFSDSLIEKWIGSTYFSKDDAQFFDDDACDCCGRCD